VQIQTVWCIKFIKATARSNEFHSIEIEDLTLHSKKLDILGKTPRSLTY